MKAIVYHDYGPPDVLRCEEVEKPVPGDDEVLIRVRAAAINPLDAHLMRGRPYLARLALGLRRPRTARPGRDVAGDVESVGKSVTGFKPGDAVFGACRGALAEYACAPQSSLAAKPANMSFEQAASVAVAGLTALQGLRDKGRLEAGQKVLVNGAAGGIGTFAVQIAKAFGAEVTAVCRADAADLVRSIGADRVVDYAKEDFTRSGERYDLILDAVGNLSLPACRRSLTPDGILVAAGGGVGPHPPRLGRLATRLIGGLLLSLFGRRKMVVVVARMRQEDLNVLRGLMEAGKVAPVIDTRYGLGEVPDAVRHVMAGHARGKVVVSLEA
jgi:NADPH:quinone reductase-like Zn-dependent oxidoreductase